MRSLFSLCRSGLSRHPMIGTFGALALAAATADAQDIKTHALDAKVTRMPFDKHLIDKTAVPAGRAAQDEVQVMVELEDEPAIKVYSRARRDGHMTEEAARAESEKQAESLRQKHNKLRRRLEKEDINAKIVYSVLHAYNGIAVSVNPGNVARIRALEGVKAVHGLKPQTRLANSSVDFINTPSFWNTVANGGLNIHGEGIKIGDIDTGIDYIHKNFGGSGSAADYVTAIADRNGASPFFPNPIVAGGYDFAGDAYDADPQDATYSPVPMPDPNPFDSPNVTDEGHGTGTASILAGRGVSSDGTTFLGPYDSTVPLASEILGPGIAPAAQIYAYRVFGDTGSTNLTVQAIDQGVIDKVDVLNLSLGSDFGSGDAPDAIALDNASEAGIICVAAAGNAGDSYYITGDPAASLRGLSVAASYNNDYSILSLTGVAPTAIAGQTFGYTPGTAGPAITGPIAPQDVVYALPHIGIAQNPDGTFPNLSNAASINGHIALIDRGTLSFYIKVAECQQAGATAVIIANNQPGAISPITSGPGPNGTTYTPSIPNGVVSQQDGNTLKTYLDATNGTDTGEQVSFSLQNGADVIAGYSSRGPRRPDGLLKPDVTAPAEAVDVAKNTTGMGIQSFNGTSSATPHVAGTMALLKQAHPTWTVEQLKALVMNTADHDLFVNPGESGTRFGPGRIGNGRIDLTPASTASVIAYNADLPGAVSVSFGPVDVPIDIASPLAVSHTINVVNKSTKAAQSFNVSFGSVGTDIPGVTFAVSPTTVSVPAATATADGLATVTVTMTADPTQMLHTHDPSIAATQGGLTRDYKSEATGYVQFSPTAISGTPIRLVVHAMPRPVSTAHVASTTLSLPGTTGTVDVPFTGNAVENGDAGPVGIFSFLKMLELQYTGTGAFNDGTYDDSANIQYVGVSSDYAAEGNSLASTVFQFGIVSYLDHPAPDYNSAEFDILIDTTGGATFTPNYDIYDFVLGTTPNYENIYAPFVINLVTGQTVTSGFVIDALSGPVGYDTNIFNTNVLTYPIPASVLGMTDTSNPVIHYQVVSYYEGLFVGDTPILTYDPTHPGLLQAGERRAVPQRRPRQLAGYLRADHAGLRQRRSAGQPFARSPGDPFP